MAQNRRLQGVKRRQERVTAKSVIFTVVVALVLCGTLFVFINDTFMKLDGIPSVYDILCVMGIAKKPLVKTQVSGEATVHFIDVGQGDCELIVTEKYTVLIDSGEDSSVTEVIGYIHSLGITKLDYVIATHPHSDHIGGMYEILERFDVGRFIMPEIDEDYEPNTVSYEKMLDVIEKKNINASYANAGEVIFLGEGSALEIIAPVRNDYEALNNYSVTAKLIFGNTSFLFTGDIEALAESDIIQSVTNVNCDVIKVPHHGSSTSSSKEFLLAARPKYAVIEVGLQNDFGHPKTEVLRRYKSLGCTIYTTAESGDIVFVSDGSEITVVTEKGSEAA
ncbi:MAG: ComEC/Rec2 family competence protein [Oscillospiraceae bacterium]